MLHRKCLFTIYYYKLQKNNVYIIGVDCSIDDISSDSYLLFYDKDFGKNDLE